jgi:drug/metabolite transporter (DMT)-like permease
MSGPALSVILAFLGYSILNIGQAGQKIGLAKRANRKVAGWSLWVAATLATSVAFFIILGAIALGSVSIVGAMAGTGLATLAVFSHFVMKDKLDLREVIATVVVIGGAAVVGVFATERVTGETRVTLLWVILGGGAGAFIVAWIIARRASFAGTLIGSFSGFLGAYSQLFQKYVTTEISILDGVGPFLRYLVTNPVTLVWIGLSVASMIVLQFSYKHGRAIEIIPAFTGTFIAVPVVGGVLIFGETLLAVQWVGVALIAAGAIVLGRGQES